MSNNGLLGNPRVAGKPLASPLYTNLSANLILAPSDMMKSIRIGFTNGYDVYLPNATLLGINARQIRIVNTQSSKVGIYDYAGKMITILQPYASVMLWCTNVATVKGIWLADNSVMVTNYGTNYLAGQTNSLFSITTLSSKKALVVYGDSTNGNALSGIVLTVDDNNAISYSSRTFLGIITTNLQICAFDENWVVLLTDAAGVGCRLLYVNPNNTITSYTDVAVSGTDNYFSYPALSKLSTTSIILAYRNGSSAYVHTRVLSKPSASLTIGDVTIVASSASHISVCGLDEATAIVVYRGYSIYGNLLTISGTSVTAGSTVDITSNSSSCPSVAKLSTTVAIVVYGSGVYIKLRMLTKSGSTFTLGTEYASDITYVYPKGASISIMNPTTGIIFHYGGGAAYSPLNSNFLTIADNTVTITSNVQVNSTSSADNYRNDNNTCALLDKMTALAFSYASNGYFYGRAISKAPVNY